MRMRTTNAVIAGIAAMASSVAFAEPNVTVYGIVDSGVELLSNVGPGKNQLVRVPSVTGTLPSRLGFKGSEDLGNGLKAIFALEMGLALDTGSAGQGGRTFGRQAYVGLSSDMGTVSIGRIYTMLLQSMFESDVLGPNLYGTGSFDTYIPNARTDNGIGYLGHFSNWTVGATYSTGRESVASVPPSGACPGESATASSACHGWSALVKYKTKAYGVALAIDKLTGGGTSAGYFANGAAPVPMTSSADSDRRISLGAFAQLEQIRIGAGWIGRKVDTNAADVRSNLYYLGATYPIGNAIVLDGQLLRMVNKDQDRNATGLVLRSMYKFSKRSAAYAQLGFVDNSSKAAYTISQGGGTTPAVGENQTGLMLGMRHAF